MFWSPARLQPRGLNYPPRLSQCLPAMETVNIFLSLLQNIGLLIKRIGLHVQQILVNPLNLSRLLTRTSLG